MLIWFFKWIAMRSIAMLAGAVLYIYCAIYYAGIVRVVQGFSAQIADFLAAQMPDEYAVWIPSLNMETSLTFLMFVVFGMLAIDASHRTLILLWRMLRGKKKDQP